MQDLKLSFCCTLTDRTKAIFDGSVKPEGIELNSSKVIHPHEHFARTIKLREHDLTEFSMSNYIFTRANGLDLGYIALPIFTSKKFRHKDIYINKNSGIHVPADLKGKRVASSPAYYVTAAIWQRGVLQNEFDVPLSSIEWYAENEERIHAKFPNGISVKVIDEVDAKLEHGDIDALIGPRRPESFAFSKTMKDKGSNIVRLFPDPKSAEQDYYRRTGIFPIMHVLLLREKIWRENKWIAESLMEAFTRSKKEWRQRTASRLGGPVWIDLLYEEEESEFGSDSYPYGIGDNRKNLTQLIEYCSEQAIMDRTPTVEELFVDNIS